MNLIALQKKKLGKITAILASDAGDQCFFHLFTPQRKLMNFGGRCWLS
jgi:hypothetical protein